MSEKAPTNENVNERIPLQAEVLEIFGELTDGTFEIVRSLNDGRGLYLLEVQTRDEAGDIVQYNYTRKVSYEETRSTEIVIDVIYYVGDMPRGGHPIMKYIDGEWVREA